MSVRVLVKWTPAAKSTLYGLWKSGMCASRIADVIEAEHGLAVTKSSVIGVAFRAGLSFQGPRSPESLAAARSARVARAARRVPTEESRRRDRERKAARRSGVATPAAAPKPAPAPRPAVAVAPKPARSAEIPVSLRILLTAVRDGQCRFIADDPKAAPATCCGHATMSGSAWCAGHHALCTVPIRKPVSIWTPEHRRAA